MSVKFFFEDVEVLIFEPAEFRRVHLLEGDKLKYSHSELIITINEQRVMVDIIMTLLDSATYEVRINGLDFSAALNTADSLHHVKHLIFINFPDLPVSDVYCNKVLKAD